MINNYFINTNQGMLYGMGNIPFMATTHDERGRYISYYTRVEDGLGLFDANIDDIFIDFYESESSFTLGFYEKEVMSEVANLKLPYDTEKDLKGLTYPERLNKIDKVKHFDLYIEPQLERPDKYSSCWIWVKLPEEIEGVNYIPIVIHHGGGVTVHPYFHKHFLRSFNNRERHVILGFCYIYGPTIEGICISNAKNDTDFSDKELRELKIGALNYRDTDAPKRINFGPDKNVVKRLHPSVDDYYNWMDRMRTELK